MIGAGGNLSKPLANALGLIDFPGGGALSTGGADPIGIRSAVLNHKHAALAVMPHHAAFAIAVTLIRTRTAGITGLGRCQIDARDTGIAGIRRTPVNVRAGVAISRKTVATGTDDRASGIIAGGIGITGRIRASDGSGCRFGITDQRRGIHIVL